MEIIIDTNILHQEGLRSNNMLLLSRLSKSNKVDVYIPEIVKREYLSKKIHSAKEDLSVVIGRVSNIKKWMGVNEEISKDLESLENQFKELYKKVEEPINHSFEQWVEDYNIVINEFDPYNIVQVLDDYFTGDGVFKKARNRDDLPDAMINATIQEILELYETVYVVIKDGNFKEYLDGVKGVSTFDNLSDLFKDLDVKRLIDELDSESRRIEAIKQILLDDDVRDRLHSFILSDKAYIESTLLDEDEIKINTEFGLDYSNQYIDQVDVDSINNLKFGEINFKDDNSLFINITFFADAWLRYLANYGDYNRLPNDRKSSISADVESYGDDICLLSEEYTFKFSGYLEIWLYETMKPEEFKVHTQYLQTDESELHVLVSITSAELQ